jgi:hypothetical protein
MYNLNDVISILRKHFNLNETLYNTSFIEVNNILYIASHGHENYNMHRYFLISFKNGSIIYSNSNVIDSNIFKNAKDLRQETINYLNHILKHI